MIPEHIYNLIARTLSGEASTQDQQQLDAWLAEDTRNQVAYDELCQLWDSADDLLAGPAFDTERAWQQVATRMTAAPDRIEARHQPAPATGGRSIPFSASIRWAMAAAAVLLIGFFGFRYYNSMELTLVADAGTRQMTLPDGSTVWLRAGSRLQYPRRFASAERHVSLEGEAFFDVAHNPAQPFTIDAGPASVRVLGTSFHVRSGDDAAVVVVSGKVRMSAGSDTAGLVLTPGQEGRLQNGRLQQQAAAPTDNALYWKTGIMQFSDTPLAEVVRQIRAYADVDLSLDPASDEAFRSQHITYSLRSQPAETIVSELSQIIAGGSWAREGDTYIIRQSTNP